MNQVTRLFVSIVSILSLTNAFVVRSTTNNNRLVAFSPSTHYRPLTLSSKSDTKLFEKKFDASKSGNKRERLDRLAELEESKVETDSTFVYAVGGGFIAIMVILFGIALSSGVIDEATSGGYS